MSKDKFGPEYVLKVYNSKIGLEGILVIDNTVLGPGKGGIRLTSDITEKEVFRLARTMTWKNALAELPFGGAKAGIVWPGGNDELKKKYIQSFAQAIEPFLPGLYIAGPDVNTGEKEMRWFVEATGIWNSATGKPANLCMKIFGQPREKCGLPHEYGSAGFGVAQATATAASLKGINIKGARVSIHGFGNVGSFTYQYLTALGAKMIALADIGGTIFDEDGLDKNAIQKIIKERLPLSEYPDQKAKIKSEDFWQLPVDILILASVTDVINEENKNDVKAKIIVEAANIPMPENVEKELFQKGVLIVPDFVANAGGVISSFAEYQGYNPKRMFATVEKKIKKNVKIVLEKSLKQNKNPREVALAMAQARVEAKMKN